MTEPIEPLTDDDRAVPLGEWYAACQNRLEHGWEDVPLLASPVRCLMAILRRAHAAEAHAEKLLEAIRRHHGYRVEDLCWINDDELYRAAGLPARDSHVGDKFAMLGNCVRYVDRRCRSGPEGAEWPSYDQLEGRVKELTDEVEQLERELGDRIGKG